MEKILTYFHHIHHLPEHKVHHCSFGYTIEHCSCGKHKINIETAIGHDFDYKETVVNFLEVCPDGGWHVESGIVDADETFKLGVSNFVKDL